MDGRRLAAQLPFLESTSWRFVRDELAASQLRSGAIQDPPHPNAQHLGMIMKEHDDVSGKLLYAGESDSRLPPNLGISAIVTAPAAEKQRLGSCRERGSRTRTFSLRQRQGSGEGIQILARQIPRVLQQVRKPAICIFIGNGRHIESEVGRVGHAIPEAAASAYMGVRQGPLGTDRRQHSAI